MNRVAALELLLAALLLPVAFAGQTATLQAADLGPDLAKIRQLGKGGAGHVAAMAAYREIVQADASDMTQILAGFEGAGPLAENWLRAAVDTVAQRRLDSGGELPVTQLQAFVKDVSNPPRGRSLAFEWLCRVQSAVRITLLKDMLDDPSGDLRRAAVELAIEAAGKIDGEKERRRAIAAYSEVLTAARDLDQVDRIEKRLTDLGVAVDVADHFGFIVDWRLIGPFTNEDRKGYHTVFPPEKDLDVDATYQGLLGEVTWKPYSTTERLGKVDFNKAIVNRKQVTAYAWTQLVSPRPMEVEFRWSTRNANKLWLNGKLLAENEVYHSGGAFDQYRALGTLNRGINVVLVKVCQNEQTQPWTNTWQIQLRVCDVSGTPLPQVVAQPPKK